MSSDEEELEAELERSQSLVDLGEAIGKHGREQSARRERELDARQAQLDKERSRTGNGDSAQTKAFDEAQSTLDRARQREREIQQSLDEAQAEREAHQEELDRQRSGETPED